MIVGYARVSTIAQDVEMQHQALLELGAEPERIYTDEGFSGKSLNRAGLREAMAAVREGDTLVVPRLDRFARNAEETLRQVRELTERGVIFQMGRTAYDPRDPWSKLFLTFLAGMAEAEGAWISLRTQEGMANPEVRKKLKGRQSKLTSEQDEAIAIHLEEGRMTPGQIATRFNTSRSSIYRAASRHRARMGGGNG